MRYLACLFAGGNEEEVRSVYRRLLAVRISRRAGNVGDLPAQEAEAALALAGISAKEAEAIYRLTSLSNMQQRVVIPPMLREQAAEAEPEPVESQGPSE